MYLRGKLLFLVLAAVIIAALLMVSCGNDEDEVGPRFSNTELIAQFPNGNQPGVGSSSENCLQVVYPIRLDSTRDDGVNYFQICDMMDQIGRAIEDGSINVNTFIANRLRYDRMTVTSVSDSLVIGHAAGWVDGEPDDTLLYWEWTQPEEPIAVLYLKIDGCGCSEYSKFILTWYNASSPLIDTLALANALIAADSSGQLLCDCSQGDCDAYVSVIKSVEPYGSGNGLEIVLNREVNLNFFHITENLLAILVSNNAAIFGGHDFEIEM